MKNQIFAILALVMFSQSGIAKVKYQYCYRDGYYPTACSEFHDSAIVAQEESYNRCMKQYSWLGCNVFNEKFLETKEVEEKKSEQVSSQPTYVYVQPTAAAKLPAQVSFLLGSNAQLTYAGIKNANGELVSGEDMRNFGDRRDAVASQILSTLKSQTPINVALVDVQVNEQDLNERSKFSVTLKLGATELGEQLKFETFDTLYVDEIKASLNKGTPVVCWINKARVETVIKEDQVAEEQIHVDAASCLP